MIQHWLMTLMLCITPVYTETICTAVPFDLTFILDMSGSICNKDPSYDDATKTCDNWKLMKKFAVDVVENLQIGPGLTRVAAVTFSTQAQIVWNLEGYETKADLKAAFNAIPYTAGNTNIYEGLRTMRTGVFTGPGDRPGVNNGAVIVTDGAPNINAAQTPIEAERVHNASIQMIAVGVTATISETVLSYLASPPSTKGEDWFTTPDFQTLDKISQAVALQTCVTQTVPPTAPPTVHATPPTPKPQTGDQLTTILCVVIGVIVLVGIICFFCKKRTVGCSPEQNVCQNAPVARTAWCSPCQNAKGPITRWVPQQQPSIATIQVRVH